MASGTRKYRYETDAGNIFYARTDDAAALAPVRGEQPTGSITESLTFEFSKNSRAVGCKPRHCILTLKSNETPEGCMLNGTGITKRVVVLKKDHIPNIGSEIQVNGRTWVVGSVVGEQMR